ncbi:MAG TPA: FAD-binding and (Fe-S)-binding domain-containing protein [Gaiellaceae bacterium]|jgi:FAD/FMN-containing dehydrogenase/Fe-S oxidoreductase|nr:FAD-binding and (Fe-S)-binding domain-containing protein [Gaiellaceae bacterium]
MRVPAYPDRRFASPPTAFEEVDVRGLEHDLARTVEGEVRFKPGDRALYTTGGSNYRQVPIGIVIPRTTDDVVETVRLCREYRAPVLAHGGGTSLAGQCCNVAVVIDFSKYLNRIVEIDPAQRLARVQPGLILDHLRKPAEREHGLTFGPDPSTHDHCTFGGMIGNNACGVRSIMAQFYGPGPRMSDNVAELDVLLYDGRRLRVREGTSGDAEIDRRLLELRDRYGDLVRERYPNIPRRVSGYNLDDLLPERGLDVAAALTGTEGTCALVLEATVHLLNSPPVRSLLVLGYEDEYRAADHVMDVLEAKPLGCEGVDAVLLEDMKAVGIHDEYLSMLPDGHGFLLVEFGGETKDEADAKAHDLMAQLKKSAEPPTDMKLYDDEASEAHVWEVREAGLGATAFIPGKPDTYEGWEDSAVPPERLGQYLRDIRKLAGKYGYESALYGHYGNGCVHARWNFDLQSEPGIRAFRSFLDEAAELVVSHGGSISGEHGDGQSKAELLPKMFGPELVEAFREFKSIWDPDWKLNPGKVVDPYPITENLRLGTDYRPPRVKTHFAFPNDHGSFAHATTRCVGIGKCRRTDGGVMCPSFMVTREEKHTTRGRARTLWEMLNGEEIDGFRSDEVKEALDLCLSCKGCTNDCPVSVDMPTLKAEFLSHHYRGRLRPRPAYAFGLIDQAARIASKVPAIANLFAQSRVFKLAAGIHPERHVPPFAPVTLKSWFASRPSVNGGGKRVILWADTFTNYLEPEVGIAAVEALEEAGFHVVVPTGHLCCGRPLYDYGMLDLAETYLRKVLRVLRDDIRAGTPVVGIEPSCAAVFKDELVQLWPTDEDAKRLCKQTHHFSEFMAKQAEGWEPPQLHRKALLHGHCHHKATGGIAPEKELLERMGVEVEELDSGCCGMAGGWGYETGHYDVSMACGERVLLPKVREAPAETLVVADGFSCRSQIEQGRTGRGALHAAQVLALAGRYGPAGPPGGYPERAAPERPQAAPGRTAARAAVAAGAAAALAGAASYAYARLS